MFRLCNWRNILDHGAQIEPKFAINLYSWDVVMGLEVSISIIWNSHLGRSLQLNGGSIHRHVAILREFGVYTLGLKQESFKSYLPWANSTTSAEAQATNAV